MDPTSAQAIDSGSTAWMLASAAFVLLMVPGLALFYAGMVRRKNIIATMLYSYGAMALIGVQWMLFGYALAFGRSVNGVIGWDPALLGLHGIEPGKLFGDKAIPELVFVMFQGKFAIITPALISGAVAERMRFSTFLMFCFLWATFIYCPLAHWVWAPGGWLFERGVLDFAGGTVVHISSGFSALVLALLVGRRLDYQPGSGGAVLPHNLPMTLLGAGLLWFGWFGFNAGSAVAVESPVAGATAGLAFATTQTRCGRGRARLDADRVVASRKAHQSGNGLGGGCRLGGGDAGGRARQTAVRAADRRRDGPRLLPGGTAQGPIRLR